MEGNCESVIFNGFSSIGMVPFSLPCCFMYIIMDEMQKYKGDFALISVGVIEEKSLDYT